MQPINISILKILEWVDLTNPGIKRASPVSPALAGMFFTTEPPGNPTPKPNRGWVMKGDVCVPGRSAE